MISAKVRWSSDKDLWMTLTAPAWVGHWPTAEHHYKN